MDIIEKLNTLDFFISNLGFCLELGLLNSETEIGTGVNSSCAIGNYV